MVNVQVVLKWGPTALALQIAFLQVRHPKRMVSLILASFVDLAWTLVPAPLLQCL